MTRTLASFAAASARSCRKKTTPPAASRWPQLLRAALSRPRLRRKPVRRDVPERKVVYEDPQLGFCILAHRYTGAKDSPPHDHGPSWAIYGQADGETVMTDWELLAAATPEQPGKVKKIRDYALTPGVAHVYNEGDLHAPSRAGPTR
jgi:hypothetical protein